MIYKVLTIHTGCHFSPTPVFDVTNEATEFLHTLACGAAMNFGFIDLFGERHTINDVRKHVALLHQYKRMYNIWIYDIFDTMIRPIITYGSDVWGLCKSGLHDLDKLFLNYIRCVLCIKATTSNIIVYGECGKFPPSIYCHANVLCYLHRLLTMRHGSTVKSVFNVLCNLNDQGFQTWSIWPGHDIPNWYEFMRWSFVIPV